MMVNHPEFHYRVHTILVPRLPTQVLTLPVQKSGRAWYIISHEHDVIDKWQKKIAKQKGGILHFVHLTTCSHLVRTTVAPH